VALAVLGIPSHRAAYRYELGGSSHFGSTRDTVAIVSIFYFHLALGAHASGAFSFLRKTVDSPHL
jgi:hypothetical protein